MKAIWVLPKNWCQVFSKSSPICFSECINILSFQNLTWHAIEHMGKAREKHLLQGKNMSQRQYAEPVAEGIFHFKCFFSLVHVEKKVYVIIWKKNRYKADQIRMCLVNGKQTWLQKMKEEHKCARIFWTVNYTFECRGCGQYHAGLLHSLSIVGLEVDSSWWKALKL